MKRYLILIVQDGDCDAFYWNCPSDKINLLENLNHSTWNGYEDDGDRWISNLKKDETDLVYYLSCVEAKNSKNYFNITETIACPVIRLHVK